MPKSNLSRSKRPRSTQVCDEFTTEDRPNHTNPVHEKVSHVARLLQDWGWSFAQLVKYWINHNNGARGRRSANKRVDILRMLFTDDAEATFKDTRDDAIMVDVMDMATTYLVQGIRAEFGELRQRSIFGQWNADEDFKDMDMSMVGRELSEHAPLFTNLMELACNTRSGGNQGYSRKEEEGYLVMLASILMLKSSRNTANRFARMLGLYLQGTGVKRRAIEVLDGLGVTECYRTLDDSKQALSTHSENIIRDMARHDDITIFYDNFDYMQKVRHQVISDHGVMYNYTTAKLVRGGIRIPEGGLLQSMLKRELPIKCHEDILWSSDIDSNGIWKDIQKCLILTAINEVYPTAVTKIYHGAENRRPSMPQLDILPCTRTEHVTMGSILEDEATVTGNYRVLENIFLKQLDLDEQFGFHERLYLVYGDQKTCSLIRLCQRQRFESSETYHRLQWLLPVTGFWHLRLNYLKVIMRTFYGGKKYSDQYSTLYTQMNHLDRRNIPKESAPFHHMEELVLHSFNARILAMLYVKIGDECDVKSSEQVEAYLSNLDVEGFHKVIDSIHAELFSRDVRYRCTKLYRETVKDSMPAIDMELVNSIRYMQVVEVYVVLRYAIKHGDLGLLRMSIARCLITFHGTSSRNYAREMLHLYRVVATAAAAPELRRAVLGCGLVNLRGRPDSFFEADRLVELLNLQLKELMRIRGNSTFDVNHLFRWCLSTVNYYLPVRAAFELGFGERTNSEHTTKSPAADIHSLGELLSQDALRQRKHRHVQFLAPDVIYLGHMRLAAGSPTDKFNEGLKSRGSTALDLEGEEGEEGDDIDLETDYLVSSAVILL